jgi:uncharacterized membrane protein
MLGAYIACALWFSGRTSFYPLYRSSGGAHVGYARARILAVRAEAVDRDDATGLLDGYQDLAVRILDGEKAGAESDIHLLNYATNIRLRAGDAFIARVDIADAAHFSVSLYSVDRAPALLLLSFLFAAALCGIGGRRGLRSILIVSVATLCVSLALLGGLGTKTLSAALGSMAGVAASVLLTLAFRPGRGFRAMPRPRPFPSSPSRDEVA